ncbi:MAG: 6-carboxyhexanoate--CoA ligase [Thermodesulfovibrionales bacterium]|nr:6-carboxyhexanoate--CoA ligase [Thermodesulfovibrionales bacterium]
MWSVRMRASKSVLIEDIQKNETQEIHISGAEGIYSEEEIPTVLREYLNRALVHSRGKPDKIFFTIENIKEAPLKVQPLTVKTLSCNSPENARKLISDKLLSLGVSLSAIDLGFKILYSPVTMRGAALIRSSSGTPCTPNPQRGVRVSRLGIDKNALNRLKKQLAQLNINTLRVREALILASKVAYHKDVIGEICISDDPDYTTGYIASKEIGYLRIPNIKRLGEMYGGRVFFIKEEANIYELINYLEKTPVQIF